MVVLERDQLARLEQLQRTRGGRVFIDVPLVHAHGRWPNGTGDHRIDAVLVPDHPDPAIVSHVDAPDSFLEAVRGRRVILVAARGMIDRPVLGLLLAGTDLFSRSYPGHGQIRQMALVRASEPNVRWVFDYHGIEIVACDV